MKVPCSANEEIVTVTETENFNTLWYTHGATVTDSHKIVTSGVTKDNIIEKSIKVDAEYVSGDTSARLYVHCDSPPYVYGDTEIQYYHMASGDGDAIFRITFTFQYKKKGAAKFDVKFNGAEVPGIKFNKKIMEPKI